MRVLMPDATWQGTLLKGGWYANVPEISVAKDDARYRALVLRFMRLGQRPLDAERLAEKSIKDFFAREWKARLMKLVARWAKMYADQNFGSLEGFDPEVISETWVPGYAFFKPTGAEAQKLFTEMRRNVNMDISEALS